MQIFIVSGDEDPVGAKGRLTAKLYEVYRKHGLFVSHKLYPGGRHEILNEPYREEVYDSIISFIENHFE